MRKYYTYQVKKSVSVIDLKTVEKLNLYKGYSYPQEKHVFFEFVYVKKGEIFCNINGEIYTLKTGDFRLIAPQNTHYYYSNENAEIFIVCFRSKSNILEILDDTISLDISNQMLIEKIMGESENAFEFPFTERLVPLSNAIFGAGQLTENLIEQLLINILRDKIESSKITFVKNANELKNNIVLDTINILKNGIYGNVSLKDVCNKTLYSSTYLNELFKKKKGLTVMKYYQSLKIEEATKLLEKGETITSVSFKLGFIDANYFCKVFKKFKKISPTTFIKMYKNKK